MTIPNLNVSAANPTIPAIPASVNAGDSAGTGFWGDAGAFKNFLDIINPLQHLPVVSTIYHAMTGDNESSGARLAGGALYGGPIGFAAALANEVVQTQTGKDIGGNVLAMMQAGDAHVQLAQNEPDGASSPVGHVSPNQRGAYNAYVKTQSLLA